MFKNRCKYVRETLINKARDVSPSTDLDILRRLMVLKAIELERGGKIKKDDERVGKTIGQGLLYTD
jgi:hypothetical protein